MKGRKPTPHNLKVIAGTDRPGRSDPEGTPEYDLLTDFPSPPQHLNVDGAFMWNDIGRKLVAARVLQVVDVYQLEQLCVAWQNFRKQAKADMPITAADNQALKALFSEFGMSPASRRKVTSAGHKETNNPFAALDKGAKK